MYPILIDVSSLIVGAIAAFAGALAAVAAVATAVGTILLAVFAYKAWNVASETLEAARLSANASRDAANQSRMTVIQMREDSAAMKEDSARNSRPYVYVEAVPSLWGAGFWDLIIQNQGRSTARNVKIDLNQAIPNDKIGEDLRGAMDRAYTLTPTARLRFSWRIDRDGLPVEGMPAETIAKVSYRNDAGQPFKDDFALDAPLVSNAFPAPTVGDEAVESDPERSLRNIRLGLEAIATHLGEIRR